jgi:hypothetical protein
VPEPTGKLADPDWRRERARRAGQAAHSLDHYVRKVVDRAPELTPEQRDKLAAILRPANNRGADA